MVLFAALLKHDKSLKSPKTGPFLVEKRVGDGQRSQREERRKDIERGEKDKVEKDQKEAVKEGWLKELNGAVAAEGLGVEDTYLRTWVSLLFWLGFFYPT